MIAREKKRARMVKRLSSLRSKLKSIVNGVNSDDAERWDANLKLQQLSPNTSKVRQVNRCRQCGRPRGVYKRFGLCRIHLREAAMRGDVPGMVKASW